jgi:DNA-binding MarR family transcriptional regulator
MAFRPLIRRRLSRLTTYRAALLEAHSHRLLSTHLNRSLKLYRLTVPEWSLVGQLYDKGPLRLSAVADALGVEPSLATNLVKDLTRKNFTRLTIDSTDGRAKLVQLAPRARQRVPAIEQKLRVDLQQLLEGLKPSDLVAYTKVQRFIIKRDH